MVPWLDKECLIPSNVRISWPTWSFAYLSWGTVTAISLFVEYLFVGPQSKDKDTSVQEFLWIHNDGRAYQIKKWVIKLTNSCLSFLNESPNTVITCANYIFYCSSRPYNSLNIITSFTTTIQENVPLSPRLSLQHCQIRSIGQKDERSCIIQA